MAFKDTCTTLKKVAPDEPIFVLRGQDASALAVILYWLQQNPQIVGARFDKALACARAMKQWPKTKSAD
jgi:hypothetical protein